MLWSVLFSSLRSIRRRRKVKVYANPPRNAIVYELCSRRTERVDSPRTLYASRPSLRKDCRDRKAFARATVGHHEEHPIVLLMMPTPRNGVRVCASTVSSMASPTLRSRGTSGGGRRRTLRSGFSGSTYCAENKSRLCKVTFACGIRRYHTGAPCHVGDHPA